MIGFRLTHIRFVFSLFLSSGMSVSFCVYLVSFVPPHRSFFPYSSFYCIFFTVSVFLLSIFWFSCLFPVCFISSFLLVLFALRFELFQDLCSRKSFAASSNRGPWKLEWYCLTRSACCCVRYSNAFARCGSAVQTRNFEFWLSLSIDFRYSRTFLAHETCIPGTRTPLCGTHVIMYLFVFQYFIAAWKVMCGVLWT
jgi:hypothetical protein